MKCNPEIFTMIVIMILIVLFTVLVLRQPIT